MGRCKVTVTHECGGGGFVLPALGIGAGLAFAASMAGPLAAAVTVALGWLLVAAQFAVGALAAAAVGYGTHRVLAARRDRQALDPAPPVPLRVTAHRMDREIA